MSRRAKFRSGIVLETCACHKTTATLSTYSLNYKCLYAVSEDLSPSKAVTDQVLDWGKHHWPRELDFDEEISSDLADKETHYHGVRKTQPARHYASTGSKKV